MLCRCAVVLSQYVDFAVHGVFVLAYAHALYMVLHIDISVNFKHHYLQLLITNIGLRPRPTFFSFSYSGGDHDSDRMAVLVCV